MSVIHVIAQLPLDNRYTQSYWNEYKRLPDYKTFPPGPYTHRGVDRSKAYNWFSNLEDAAIFEYDQLRWLFLEDKVEYLLIADLDFPGGAASYIPPLRLKHPRMVVAAMLHAGPWCNGDIFSTSNTKAAISLGAILACDLVLVATEYHKDKIEKFYRRQFQNIVVANGLYFDYSHVQEFFTPIYEKTKDVLILGRDEQSYPYWQLFDKEKISYEHIGGLWEREEYLAELAKYTVVVMAKREETFGLSAIEAASVGAIVLAPRAYAYPEILPHSTLFTDDSMLLRYTHGVLDDDLFCVIESNDTIEYAKAHYPAYEHKMEYIATMIKEHNVHRIS